MKRSPLQRKTPLKRGTSELKRSPLSKTRKRRQMKPDAMVAVIQDAMLHREPFSDPDGHCAYAEAWVRFGAGESLYLAQVSCSGESAFDHLYEQAWLREDFFDPIDGTDKAQLAKALADRRLGRVACREHHGYRTSGQLDGAPASDFYEALEEYGLVDKWENRQAKRAAA